MISSTVQGEDALSPMIKPIAHDQPSDATSPKTSTVALVDYLGLSRDCLMRCLPSCFGQELVIKSFASIEELIASEPAGLDLLLFYTHNQAPESFEAAMKAIGDVPVLLMTDNKVADVRLLFGDALKAKISGLMSTVDSNINLLSATIKFVISGGMFFPSEMISGDFETPMQPAISEIIPSGLTPRQFDVFAKLQQGKSNKVIAHELGMSASTAKVHVANIMKTIGAANRTQAVLIGQKRFGFNATPQIKP